MPAPVSIIRHCCAVFCLALFTPPVQAIDAGDTDCDCRCQAYSELLEALALDLPAAFATIDECGHRCAIQWASCEATDLDQNDDSDRNDRTGIPNNPPTF